MHSINIHKEVYGEGKPIVLIHGWAMHTGIWRRFAQQLALQHKVICLDLPGHGLSDAVTPYTLEQISDSLIKAVDDTSFCVLGWSFGAHVALTMANKYPQRINSVVFLAGNPRFIQDGEWAGITPSILNLFAGSLSENCQLTLLRFLALQVNRLTNGKTILKDLKKAVKECAPPSEGILQNALDILKQADLRDYLTSLHCPISLSQGDKDTLVPTQACQNMHALQAACEVNIITGAGHVPFLSHPEQLVKTINKFVWKQ